MNYQKYLSESSLTVINFFRKHAFCIGHTIEKEPCGERVFKKMTICWSDREEQTGVSTEDEVDKEVEPKVMIRIRTYR